MSVFVMPLRNDLPSYNFRVDLFGVLYTLRFRYNTRMQRWIMGVLDASGTTEIVNGLPILIRVALYNRFVMDGLPEGALIAYDDRIDQDQPTKNSFGTTHSLLYVEPGT